MSTRKDIKSKREQGSNRNGTTLLLIFPSTDSSQQTCLFSTHFLRQGNDRIVAFDSSNKGQSDASVARSGLDERAAVMSRLACGWMDAPFLFGLFDHAKRDAIFDAAASAHVLAFDIHLARDAIELR